MSEIRKAFRLLTSEEREFLFHSADSGFFGKDSAALSSIHEVVEYQLNIQDVLYPRDVNDRLPEKQHLYLLKIDDSLSLAFEHCFMDDAFVTGQFPSNRLSIAFGLAGDNVISRRAISYTWTGTGLPVREIEKADCPPLDRIPSVFRSDWLDSVINT